MSDTGDRNSSASAVLSVRCLPGYPKKCPKLQISEAKGLKKEDADQLLSLLNAQANFNAREGQVMIYNLVEAAREFLSDIPPPEESHMSRLSSGGENLSAEDGEVVGSRHDARNRTFVHGSYDLYSDMSGVSWDQIFEKHVANDSQSKSPREKGLPLYKIELKGMTRGASMVERVHRKVFKAHLAGFNDVDQHEESLPDDISESELVRGGSKSVSNEVTPEKRSQLVKQMDKLYLQDVRSMSELLETSAGETIDDDKSEGAKKDLILVHLLRILSASKMSFSSTEIASELFNMGMLSQWGKDLVSEPSLFDKAFEKAFRNYLASSPLSQFWKISLDVSNVSAPSLKSRYLNDFEEISSLGHGGFGHVVLCKNKLDGRQYAVKRIRLKDESLSVNDKIMREVATLSRLQHQHIVRYYQAWFETGIGGSSTWGSTTQDDLSFSYFGASSASSIGQGNTQEMTFLYIQMEYCPRTLRQDLSSFTTLYDKQATWHLCRQIVEGLAHIHSQGIIHRDLTPNNIFFDSRNDVKIGDFGLAKFLKLEKVDQEHSFPSEASVVSMDGTSQAGTPFYTAPEIEHGWPQINEKVDMYSLGVVFLELWHPFSTSMERYFVLSELKNKGTVPTSWARDFPEQASLVQRLTSPSPSDRPSAVQILRHELPPRMEDEWLDDVLRTIQTSEDTYVYEQILSTIFDEERIKTKIKRQPNERKTTESHSSFRQCTILSTQLQDSIVELCKEVFCLHGGKRLEIAPIRLFDGENQHDRKKSVKLLTSTGNMLELTHEFRSPFVSWVITNQKVNFKRYEISWVHRKSVGHSIPHRFLQGDFDIVGGAPTVTTSEVLKIAMDIVSKFFPPDNFAIHVNHAQILEAIWSWVGVDNDKRQSIAELLSLLSSSCPQSSSRKSMWGFIRRQLMQDHDLTEAVVDKLHAVDVRFCSPADQALARLRGAISSDTTHKALEELSDLLSYLRVWRIEKHISLDVLMPPEESYYRGLYFQIYVNKENSAGSVSERSLLGIGGCYDHLLHEMWNHKVNPPAAVGVSLALEKIVHHPSVDIKYSRNDFVFSVLVCSRGGGGMLEERMELVAELWHANLKAEYVPLVDPSLTLQYEYANEHDFKCLIIITPDFSQTGSIKFRHLELKKEKEIQLDYLIRFLNDAISSQFKSPSMWN